MRRHQVGRQVRGLDEPEPHLLLGALLWVTVAAASLGLQALTGTL